MQKILAWLIHLTKHNRYKTNVLLLGALMWLVIFVLWTLGAVQ